MSDTWTFFYTVCPFVCHSVRPYENQYLRDYNSWNYQILCQYVLLVHADQVYLDFGHAHEFHA